jgi:transposase-like protein
MFERYNPGREPEESCPPRGAARRQKSQAVVRRSYPAEFRLTAVRLRLEEGFPFELIAQELGVSHSTLANWIRSYRQHGAAGLEEPSTTALRSHPQVAAAVKQKIVELKQRHPAFGVKKIAHLLRRVLFLPGSHETVRRTLHQQRLIEKRRPKRVAGFEWNGQKNGIRSFRHKDRTVLYVPFPHSFEIEKPINKLLDALLSKLA